MPKHTPWLVGLGVVFCAGLVVWFRVGMTTKEVDRVRRCALVVWEVQKAEYTYHKDIGRYGTRPQLQGKNKKKKAYLSTKDGYLLDVYCPVLKVSVRNKGKSFLVTARPEGRYHPTCRITGDDRRRPQLTGKCGGLAL